MKTLSTLALAGMFVTGVSGLALVTPAAAKDKKQDAAAAPAFKLSKPVQALAVQAQTAIQANNTAAAEPLLTQIDAAATTDDDKYIAAALHYDVANRKLAAAQAANPNAPAERTELASSLDALIAAKNTPAADRPKYLFRRGQLASVSGQYPVAADYFSRAKQAGYTDPDFELQLAQTKIQAGDATDGLADLEAEVNRRETAGQKAPESFYRYAISQSLQRKLTPQTVTWLKKYATAYPNEKTWYGVAMTYGIQQTSVIKADRTQQIDLFRLMRAANALADQSLYEQYAQQANDAGNPYEAQAVIKEGLASGKLQASPFIKSMQTLAATGIRAEGSLAGTEKAAAAAATGDRLAQTADAYLGQGDNAKAATLYRAALEKPVGKVSKDQINTHLGIALARSGDKAGSTAAFSAVTGTPDNAGIASLWATYNQVGSGPAPATTTAG